MASRLHRLRRMSERSLSVLILHRMGNPAVAPHFLRKHVMSFQESFPESVCLFHDVKLPLPSLVRGISFDAVFLDVTMLGSRWRGEEEFARVKSEYAFIRELPSARIAFPQDEYDCSETLDDWMCEWNVHCVMSVLPGHEAVLYPKFRKRGQIQLGFTGYVDEAMIGRAVLPHKNRRIDIGYRAKKLLPYFGRMGEVKWTIARDVLAQCKGSGLVTDIAWGDGRVISGGQWLDFLGDCRFTIGSNSGSSLLDPRGAIQQRVKEYVAHHSHAQFDEVEGACFRGEDGRHSMSAISPRAIEAALLGTGQLLVDGEYSGVLRPNEHFLALRPDASNFSQVREAMRDVTAVEAMIARCREAILDDHRLRYSARDRLLDGLIRSVGVGRTVPADTQDTRSIVDAYQSHMAPAYRALWNREAREAQLRKALARLPVPIARAIRNVAARIGR